MPALVQALVSGIAIGCVYALIALGFVLVYKASEMINFAQGELMMLGAYVAFTCTAGGLGYGATLAATALAMFAFGYLLDATVIRRVLGQPQFVVVILTIGLGLVIKGVAAMVWGADTKNLVTPFSTGTLAIGPATLQLRLLVIVAAAAALIAMLWLFFSRTGIGIAMQGTSENQVAAALVGIPLKRILSLAWAISAAVSGIAGALVAPVVLVDPNMGMLGLNAFAAAVIGGFGSMPGAAVGGILVGVTQQLASYYLPEGWREAAPYLLMLDVLAVAREGLFGRGQAKKV